MFILREEFPDHFKCLNLDSLDFLVMFYLEHKENILEHYINDTLTFQECLHYFFLQRPITGLVKVFRQRELQGTLRITNEFNDYVQNQIVSFEEWCNFIFMEYDNII